MNVTDAGTNKRTVPPAKYSPLSDRASVSPTWARGLTLKAIVPTTPSTADPVGLNPSMKILVLDEDSTR